jgi:hypothetical protein
MGKLKGVIIETKPIGNLLIIQLMPAFLAERSKLEYSPVLLTDSSAAIVNVSIALNNK